MSLLLSPGSPAPHAGRYAYAGKGPLVASVDFGLHGGMYPKFSADQRQVVCKCEAGQSLPPTPEGWSGGGWFYLGNS